MSTKKMTKADLEAALELEREKFAKIDAILQGVEQDITRIKALGSSYWWVDDPKNGGFKVDAIKEARELCVAEVEG